MVIYVYRKNIFGDITAIYKGATCVAKYKYDAWGNCTVCNPDGTVNTSETFIGNINPFRYRGYYWDNDLQLYYLQTRYYDPSVCRFISPDSHEYLDPETFGGLNLYAYCLNNPINNYDPTGHFSLPNWAKWVIGGVAFAGAVALTALTGGALAPMFIHFGTSIALSGIIQGATNAIHGENFWEGFVDGMANGALIGGVLALGQSVIRVVKVANYASKGLTIGKKGTFEKLGEMTGTSHYGGLKSRGFLEEVFGKTFADKVGWIQNKSIIQGVMKFKGIIYDCGGPLTGVYAKEIALTKGYQYIFNIWLL